MAKFMIQPTIGVVPDTVRLGSTPDVVGRLGDSERGKAVKLAGESRYDLASAGDALEAVIFSVEPATLDGYTIGGIQDEGALNVTFDGLQATPGVGTVAVGDWIVVGTVAPKGAANAGPVKVCKATSQTPGVFAWRVVSLGAVGTGAVGTAGVIDRANG